MFFSDHLIVIIGKIKFHPVSRGFLQSFSSLSFIIIVSESSKQIGPHACTVCQSVVEGNTHSRALPRSQASQYGLREDQVLPGARVCNTCRCKAVRGRYTACPLPGCPNLNSSKSRVKRLRALPSKWLDLPPEIREPIAQEFREYF